MHCQLLSYAHKYIAMHGLLYVNETYYFQQVLASSFHSTIYCTQRNLQYFSFIYIYTHAHTHTHTISLVRVMPCVSITCNVISKSRTCAKREFTKISINFILKKNKSMLQNIFYFLFLNFNIKSLS